MPSPSSRICRQTESSSRQLLDADIVVPAGAYFAALSRRLNSACSNSTASSPASADRRRAPATPCDGENLAGAPQRAADDLAEIVRRGIRHDGAGFQLGHVEQIGDEAVEPLGLVDDGCQQIALFGIAESACRDPASSPAAPSTEASGVLRSCEIEVKQRRSQPVGLDGALDAIHVLDQPHALDRERALIHQRVEQPALVRRQQRPGLVARRCR